MYKGNHIVALVPMKGHLERVPNKNMRLFHGKPLYYYIIHTLLQVEYIDQIIINTDGQQLKEDLAVRFPMVEVHSRPEGLQGDFVSMNEIIQYDMSHSKAEYFLQTHATNPLLKPETVKSTIEKYFECLEDRDSLFTVTKLQVRLYDWGGKPINHNPEELVRTQDLMPVFVENSNLYLFSKKSFLENGCKRIGKRPQLFEMDQLEATDIDEKEDFILAEALYKLKVGSA